MIDLLVTVFSHLTSVIFFALLAIVGLLVIKRMLDAGELHREVHCSRMASDIDARLARIRDAQRSLKNTERECELRPRSGIRRVLQS